MESGDEDASDEGLGNTPRRNDDTGSHVAGSSADGEPLAAGEPHFEVPFGPVEGEVGIGSVRLPLNPASKYNFDAPFAPLEGMVGSDELAERTLLK